MRQADVEAFGEFCELYAEELVNLAREAGGWDQLGRKIGAIVESDQRMKAEHERRLAARLAARQQEGQA